jgi:hypothetical protein
MSHRKSGRILGASALVGAVILGAGQASAQNETCGGPGLVNAPDLTVGVLTGPSNYAAAGGLDALSIGTTSCNMGNLNVQWNACSAVTHPVIGGNLYRWSTVNGATRFEQVGLSWLKHAFTALTNNDCCTCNGQGGSVLGVGCSDPYTSGRNGSQGGLGPRGEVNAFTGTYPTATCNHHPSGGNTGRLEVLLTDLFNTSGGTGQPFRYFGEAQYVNHDDATWSDASHPAGWLSTNNASYIEVTVSSTSTSNYDFGFLGSTVRFRSAIRAWKSIDPTVTESIIDTPTVGRFIVCSKATSIGGGLYHYEYAVYNMNSDRSGGTFTVPIDDTIAASNIGFHGVVYRGGDGVTFGTNYSSTDWTSNKSGGLITWSTTPFTTDANANAIRWGTTYNFRFDAPAAPVDGNVTVGLFKTGSPASITAAAQVPGTLIAPPAPPTNVTAVPNPACDGNSTSISGTVGAGQTIDWYTGSCGGTFVNVGTAVSVTPVAQTTYYARARVISTGAVSTTCGSVTVDVASSPSISQQPAPATVASGQPASFQVGASGTAPNYQWRKDGNNLSDGGSISGSMTANLSINPALTTDAGNYDVVISNTCFTVTSSAAALAVTGHCGSADFNHDGDVGTDADIDAFFACLGGSCCATCESADFNGDGDLGTDADIEAFFRVLGGGSC